MPIELFVAAFVVIGMPAAVFIYAVLIGHDEKEPFEIEDDWGSQDYQGRK